MNIKFKTVISVIVVLIGSSIAVADVESPVITAMEEEMQRSMVKLQLESFERPYYISYSINELKNITLRASYGALLTDSDSDSRYISVDVRVGDYRFDNTPNDVSFFRFPDSFDLFTRGLRRAPLDDDLDAVRQRLWLLTDTRYKQALDALNRKKGELINKVEEEDRPDDFSREEPSVVIKPLKMLDLNREAWIENVKDVSELFKPHPNILTSDVSMSANLRNQFMINTEGSKIQLSDYTFSISVSADAKCEDGMTVSHIKTWKASSIADLPTREDLLQGTADLIDELKALREAEPATPYSGPAIVLNSAAGVFFHEALGHRLEGHRLRNELEGHTFKGKMGEKVIPEFLSVYDDPNITDFEGTPLYGHYDYDQEGVDAQRVELVTDGVLSGFLMCRLPTKDISNSNGHGRSDAFSRPVSRMGNLFVETNDPKSYDELVQQLVDQCREQGKEYGLIFEKMTGGETNTSGFGIQSLRCRPLVVRKLYIDDLRTELVRGVELIGTPLNILENVIAAGDDPAVFNGACGAESGYIPVSAIAPSILISKIEIQKTNQESSRPPILPPPAFD